VTDERPREIRIPTDLKQRDDALERRVGNTVALLRILTRTANQLPRDALRQADTGPRNANGRGSLIGSAVLAIIAVALSMVALWR
jgi:hypothetical protein